MEKLLEKLYSYDYFGIYLTIAIVVLVILFFVILFFGKKDKKEREKTATLKLQQINAEAFKEDSEENSVEVKETEEQKLENDTIIVPNLNALTEENKEISEPVILAVNNPLEDNVKAEEPVSEITETPELIMEIPVNEEVKEENVVEPIVESVLPIMAENTLVFNSPILPEIEEKPLVINDIEPIKNEIEVPVIETIKDITPIEKPEEIDVPTFNFDEIIKTVEDTKTEKPVITKGPEIFSSVYVPKKEVVEEPVVEVQQIVSSNDDDFEFELPTLKKEVTPVKEEAPVVEEQLDMPVLTDYNLDELSGETYMINK